MEYRLAVLDDITDIMDLIKSAVGNMIKQGIYQWDEIYPQRSDFEEDINKNTLYLAIEKEDLVAIYVISKECDDEYRKCIWEESDESAYILHRFCVSPDFQNKGIGRTVLYHIEEQIKDMGYSSIRLDVFTENPIALRLYQNNGYIQRGYADWRKGRFLLMEKKLL